MVQSVLRFSVQVGIFILVLTSVACTPQWRVISHDASLVKMPSESIKMLSALGSPSNQITTKLSDSSFSGVQVQLPVQWVLAPVTGNRLLMTKDGLLMQQIGISVLGPEQAFGGRRKNSLLKMTPLELQELQLIDLKNFNAYPAIQSSTEIKREGGAFLAEEVKPDASTLAKVSARAIMVNGVPAFELVTSSYNVVGTEFKMKTIGFIFDQHYWIIYYMAPALFFYDTDDYVFKQMVDSVRFFRPQTKASYSVPSS